jgi:hypothetical protein
MYRLVVNSFHQMAMVATGNPNKRQRLEESSMAPELDGTPPPPEETTEEGLTLSNDPQEQVVDPPSLDVLPKQLLPQLFQFLDSAQDVFNLAVCSKKLHEAVTPTIVIRAAVLGRAAAVQRQVVVYRLDVYPYWLCFVHPSSHDCVVICRQMLIYEIIPAIRTNQVHPPSTFRMLRLLLAKRCERMDCCFGLNLDTMKSAALPKKPSISLGMAICVGCVKGLSTKCSSYHTGCNRFLRQPLIEATTNIPVGSIVCAKDIFRIESTMTQYDDRVKRLDQLINNATTTRSDVDTRRREEFVQAFDKAIEEHETIERAKDELAIQEANRLVEERISRKRARVGAVLEEMDQQLGDYGLKSSILAHSWKVINPYHWRPEEEECVLKYGVCRNMFGSLLKNTRTATKKNIKEVMANAEETFDNLLSNDFAPDSSTRIQDAFKLPSNAPKSHKALYDYLNAKYTIDSLLQKTPTNEFAELLRHERPWRACCSLLDADDYKDAFKRYAISKTSSRIRGEVDRLIDWIWATDPTTQPETPRVFRSCLSKLRAFDEQFAQCFSEYNILLRQFRQYCQLPETVEFIARIRGGTGESAHLSGQRIVNLVLRGCHVPMLWQSQFGNLLRHHRLIFENPRHWYEHGYSYWTHHEYLRAQPE